MSPATASAPRRWRAPSSPTPRSPRPRSSVIRTTSRARAHTRRYIKGEFPQTRGYSPAVITQGGSSVFLAGVTVSVDSNGKALTGDFEGQVREIFAKIGKTLEEAGGKLSDMVTMTVFITD